MDTTVERVHKEKLRILVIGFVTGVFGDRAEALKRLGHDVEIINVTTLLRPSNKMIRFWMWHSGALGVETLMLRQLLKSMPSGNFDVAWIDTTNYFGRKALLALKKRCRLLLHYNHDDPFGPRDGRHWRLFLRSVDLYDLIAVVRSENVEEARQLGARHVMRVFRSADEVSHRPREMSEALRQQWATEVLFIGTWFPERGPFLVDLVRRGVPLSIIGDRWEKAPEWPELKTHFKASHLRGDDYAHAIQASKICIGLLSKGNRDLHTTRSLEIPSLGSVLCAERTVDHELLYKDGEEAVFWSDAEECARQCKRLLDDPALRESIARKGRERYLSSGLSNEKVCARILDAVLSGEDTAK